ncbi:MAG: LptF/LptG family permease [Treponema sp.]|nr:LptF/LptG family permease [Candidatus Treponema caballi]
MKKIARRTFTRYIYRELLLYFSVCFLFFFLVFFVNQILLTIEDLLKQHVPISGIIKLITYSLPAIIAQSAPFATLVGFLMCLGRMVTDNEILILRATGHSYSFILIPAIVLGLIISIASFYVNDYLLPLGNVQYNRLYQEILFSDPSVTIESNSIKRTKDTILVIGDVEDNVVSDLLMFNTDSKGNRRIIISGETVISAPEDPSILMQLDLGHPVTVFLDSNKKESFDYLNSDKAVMNVFTSQLFVSSGGDNPREMTSGDLKKLIDEMREQGKVSKQYLNIYELEYYKKFSMPFGSLFFALLAIPLAIIFGKRNGQTIGLIIGILLSVLYWAMMIMGQTLGIRNGLNGFWTMWLPDILIGVLGLFLYVKVRVK